MAYTDIDDPSAYFQTALYTGSASSVTVTNDGNSDLQPDWLWIKARSSTTSHDIFDSSRGMTSKRLFPNLTNAEDSYGVASVTSDGFTTGTTLGDINNNGDTYVAWQWKANGGTTASNSDGSVTSTVQANQDAGFSIVTFDSASSGNFSVGHGLGVQPAMIITKNREGTGQWYTWHQHLTGGTGNTSYLLSLNRTDAEASYANAWGAGVTSSVFGMQSGNTATASNDYVAYCFSEVQGYSKFGSYVGNGSGTSDGTFNGPFVYTGFKPAWVMVKASSATSGDGWNIFDNKRPPRGGSTTGNYNQNKLYSDSNAAESGAVYDAVDFLSNGFKIRTGRGGANTSGRTYIYMAFAENPFVTSTGIPTTAR